MITETVKTFPLIFRGYDPNEVDAYIGNLINKQQVLLDDIESLRARLKESCDEAAGLRIEVAVLTDEVAVLTEASPTPQAMQRRMAKMLQRAVDEISEMQAEARAEAEALIAAAQAGAEDAHREHQERLGEMAAERKALEGEYGEAKKKFEAELAKMRAETRSTIDEAWRDAQRERDLLLADAKREADHCRDQARRVLDETGQQRIKILEQLMRIYRDLEAVPATLESAYQELKNATEPGVVVPLDQKIKRNPDSVTGLA
ncbi:cell division protein DivIVA [Mycobacterium paraense]|uniref:Cell wall synthesis protein Wag31 n=1 Tax=Mycobacterium paraense TaxID=767916 RepID=A0A1X2ADF4_9MYCO|nr:DivIVA domain-containing protein [Mycobacterium paraense]ORW49298.1 cell division protein DivIVA [Mycobacterium paraense]